MINFQVQSNFRKYIRNFKGIFPKLSILHNSTAGIAKADVSVYEFFYYLYEINLKKKKMLYHYCTENDLR